MVKNEMTLKIPSKSTNESFVRVAVAAFFTQLDPTLDEIKDVVKKNYDKTVEFIDLPDAEQYRMSTLLRHEYEKNE